jgi:tetratricopeptide (TPR) repeat protein
MAPVKLIVALAVGTSALAITVPSSSQDYDQSYRKCFNNAIPNDVIASCSFVIAQQKVDEADLATAFKNRGNAYDEQGKYGLALQDYERAIETNPQDADAFNSRGTTRTALKQYALATKDFDEAIKLNPSSSLPYSNRCFAKAALRDLQGAKADCNEALRISARSPSGFASRAFVNLLMKQYDAAIADYNAELKTRPGDPFSLYGRGVAKYQKGDLKGADHDMVEAQALKADIVEYMASIGIEPGKL